MRSSATRLSLSTGGGLLAIVLWSSTIAVARIAMDNIPHVQSSWVTMGRKTGQAALHYGCDDMGSLMLEENVVSAAGTCYSVNKDEMTRMIRSAGYEPWQRDNIYGEIAG